MAVKRQLIKEKHAKIHERFNVLYKVERRRLDDVYTILQDEFFVNSGYIQRVLAKEYE